MKRLTVLDSLRGFFILNMVVYHALWDLVYIHGVSMDWYRSAGATAWQLSIRWAFVLLSGFCFCLGRKKLRRGLVVFGCSVAVSLVTVFFVPDATILFGVLCLLGFAMLVTVPLDKLFQKLPPAAGLIASGLLFVFCEQFPWPRWLYANHLTAFFGFPHSSFFTTDYVPVFPWIFAFWMGYFLFGLVKKANLLRYFSAFRCPPLEWLGQRSLVIYMVHQPLLYGIFYLIFLLF